MLGLLVGHAVACPVALEIAFEFAALSVGATRVLKALGGDLHASRHGNPYRVTRAGVAKDGRSLMAWAGPLFVVLDMPARKAVRHG